MVIEYRIHVVFDRSADLDLPVSLYTFRSTRSDVFSSYTTPQESTIVNPRRLHLWWNRGMSSGIFLPILCDRNYLPHTQVTVSNPAEVAKTRLQLQGELSKGGGKKVYNNAIDVLSKTWKNEGIRGMQRGLGPAVSSVIVFF